MTAYEVYEAWNSGEISDFLGGLDVVAGRPE
jgi:hypothetical protein